jgi:nucleoid DNA-binding protein
VGKYDLASNIRDLTGWSLREAEMALDAVVASIAIWHQAIVRDIQEGTKAEIALRGFGTFIVTFGISYRPGNGNRTRRRQGLAPVPKLEVDFIPATELAAMTKNINRQIKQECDADFEKNVQKGEVPQLL